MTIFAKGGTTVFEVMSRLAREHDAVNLGQGFPDEGWPPELLRAAADAVLEGWNQYPPMMGLPELREAVAAHDRRFYGLDVDPAREVLVTSGATEALAASILAYVDPGDEVVVFEPLYDSYLPMIRRAGGVPRLVRLEPPDWRLDRARLAAAFGPRTRAVLLNNPMNPTGKLFTPEELAAVAELVVRHDAVAIADEVYEHIVFDGRRFTPLIAMPGMRDRTIRIASAGKTFSLTGWKVGYVTASPERLAPVARCHQFVVFTTPPNLQTAVARGLGLPDAYFEDLARRMQAKRDYLAAHLERIGFSVLPAAGAYFLSASFERLRPDLDDVAFCRLLVEEAGVALIPVSAFYDADPPRTLVRFCVCKKDSLLEEAVARLTRYFRRA
ncbi:MAG TPA: aminotransferase [Thermodesulfobacteriota bacterium]